MDTLTRSNRGGVTLLGFAMAMVAIGAIDPSPAVAQTSTRTSAATRPQTDTRTGAGARPTFEYRSGPDRALLRSALWTLGVMYGTSVVVAFTSPRAADDYLFVPIAGPWLDLSHRDTADNGKYETLYKALLVTNGLIQAFGAAQLAWSFVFGETRLVEVSSAPQDGAIALRMSPLLSGSLLGLRTEGTF